MIILIAVALLVAIAWSLFNPFVAMITLMGVNMINPGDLYHVFAALHVERVLALLALIVLFARGYRFLYPKVTRWCLYFYGACLASIPMSFWVSNAIASAIDFGKVIVIHLLYVALVNTRKRMQIVLVAFSCLIGYLCATSLNLYFHGHFQNTMSVDRITGLAGSATSADSLGLTMVTALPIVYLFTRKSSRTWVRLLMGFILLLVLWTLSLSGTRGPALTLVLIAIVGACVHHRRIFMVPAILVALPVAFMLLPEQYQARYLHVSATALAHDPSYQNRVLSWEGGLQMFLHNPITGIGIGDYTDANGAKYWPAPRKVYLNAHSLYFKVLGELGLLGVITFSGFVVVLIRSNNQVRRRLRIIDQRARDGVPRAEAVPDWLRLFPTACTLSILGLLYCGYAYHDVYRTTWYFLAAATGAADLITAREIRETEIEAQPTSATGEALAQPVGGSAA